MTRLFLTAALIAIAFVVFASSTGDHASAADVASHHAQAIDAQDEPADGGAQPSDDQRVEIMVWTLFAAAGAAATGLVLLAVRAGMGWVKPPPPQQDDAHH